MRLFAEAQQQPGGSRRERLEAGYGFVHGADGGVDLLGGEVGGEGEAHGGLGYFARDAQGGEDVRGLVAAGRAG